MKTVLRTANPSDRDGIAELISQSFNSWYEAHGHAAMFPDGAAGADIFFEVYNALEPGNVVVAEDEATGQLAGSCFFHPRPTHVSLGIMNVHPRYFGRGVARQLLEWVIDYSEANKHTALRLISSAGNLDSFSLYNRAGFLPQTIYQDMTLTVPIEGLAARPEGIGRIRSATAADAPRMAALERAVSGVERGQDYEFCIANANGFWRASVYETPAGEMIGYMIASTHQALNILGPAAAMTDAVAAALLYNELDQHRGQSPLFILPADRPALVRQAYDWGACNVELHVSQVRGKAEPMRGVVLPTFLLETA